MGDKNFRLPRTIRPTSYSFRIGPDLAAGRFTGEGSIDLVLDDAARAITLHAVDLDISIAALSTEGGAVLRLTSTTDAESQTVTLVADGAHAMIPAGTARLRLAWNGVFHDDLRGLYRAGDVAVTQFEAADARRVFPCFDEPAFKAVWNLSLAVAPGLAAVSNGRVLDDTTAGDGTRLVRFAPTPLLSSYLVALVFGPLIASDELTVRDVAIRSWSVKDKAHLTGFAQECAAAVLPLLEDYFGTPYVFGKLDQLAIPDFEAGAMENAGCITFREVVLLLDEQRTPLNVRKRVAEVITHELAHQWFGNLVTMVWWDDLWLNEAFATWMAYKIVDQWKPGWRMWDDFEGGKAAALGLDAMESTHPIRGEVRNAEEATENFDLITYEKGGSMLRMIEGYLGEAAFREGIRAYMKDHAYGNTVADDLWNALGAASQQPIRAIANGWIGRGGFPLVELARTGAEVRLSQRRFHADPERFRNARPDEEQAWLVPVVLLWADDEGVHETRLLLDQPSARVTLPARGEVRFVDGNRAGAGFYRVRYQPEEIAALCRHGERLSAVEKVELIADAWALFRAGAGPLSSLLDLLVAFGGDADYVVLGEVVMRLEMLERRYVSEDDRAGLRGFVAQLVGPQLAQVGWDAAEGERDDRRLLRAQVIKALAIVARVPEVVAEARARLDRVLGGEAAGLDPNLLDACALSSARAGDDALYDNLRARIATEPDPAAKRRFLVSLASFESPSLGARAIGEMLGDVVPMQDVTTYVGTLLGNRALQDSAWSFIDARWGDLRTKAAAPMLLRRLIESFAELSHRRAEVEAFLDAKKEQLTQVQQGVRQTLERLRLDEDLRRRAPVELSAWIRARAGA